MRARGYAPLKNPHKNEKTVQCSQVFDGGSTLIAIITQQSPQH